MKNIKRILNLILIILVILSAFALNKSFAVVTEELEATGIQSHFHKNLTNEEYQEHYDIFCCMHGVPANKIKYNQIKAGGNTYEAGNATSITVDGYTFTGFSLGSQDISEFKEKLSGLNIATGVKKEL